MKGLPVDVYRSGDGYDCTAGGPSAKRNGFILVDNEVGGPFDVKEGDVYLVIVRRNLSRGEYLHVEPRIQGRDIRKEGFVGPMFGGNFVYTSDSRFRQVSAYPLPVHDRYESQSNYNLLST